VEEEWKGKGIATERGVRMKKNNGPHANYNLAGLKRAGRPK
jgi:hypothetical protein